MAISRTLPITSTNLPLLTVNFDLELGAEEKLSGTFPPTRFRKRQARLALDRSLWDNDMSALLTDGQELLFPINYFRGVSTALADQLLQVEPIAVLDVRDPFEEALIDMSRYGLALFWGGRNAAGQPFLRTVSPLIWYPVDDGGHVFVSPYVAAPTAGAQKPQSDQENRAEIIRIDPDGRTTAQQVQWQRETIGLAIDDEQDIGVSTIARAPRSPRNGIWGTSIYDDLAPVALATGLLYSKAVDTLQGAWQSWYMDDDNARAKFPAPQDEPTERQQQVAVAEGLQALQALPVLQIPNEAVKIDALDFSGNVESVEKLINVSGEFMTFLSSVASLIRREEMPLSGMSGVALKIMNGLYYARTLAMQHSAIAAAETALSFAMGSEQSIDWPHYLDELASVTTPEDTPT